MKNLEKLQKDLAYEFKDKSLLIQALTHKSCKKSYNNERLEFLGDAVLDLVVGEYLFHKFSKDAEGDLSKLRAALVNEKSFAKIANSLNLGAFIFMSVAEENNGGKQKPSILSDALEAIIGAIHLEAGFEFAKTIALRLVEKNFPQIDAKILIKDYKTKLQELTQANKGQTPQYETLRAFGPDHLKQFEIALNLEGKELARAIGGSKKEAQQMAAKIALEKLGALE
ncbi:ribonuclease III [Campylobacter sp. VTCC 70190]|uniref:ribonuclease III n=1 Tax=Campylobacter sp. VTCC 70190 TaxID=3392118 RepID=UPI00398F109D